MLPLLPSLNLGANLQVASSSMSTERSLNAGAYVPTQAGSHCKPAVGAVPAGVPDHLLLHAQCGKVLPPAVISRRSAVVLPGRMAPARIQRAASLPRPQVRLVSS